MSWQKFYWRWLTLPFISAWRAQTYTVGALRFLLPLLVLPLVRRSLPSWGSNMTDLAWQIPLVALVGAYIIGFFLAPYQMDQEREQIENALRGALASKEKEIALLTEMKVTCEAYGIPQAFLLYGRYLYLIVPEVILTNRSYGAPASIDVTLWLLAEAGMEVRCSPDSQPLTQWEKHPDSGGFPHLAFPARLGSPDMRKGYVAFRPSGNLEGINFTPRHSPEGGALCRIEFTDGISQKVICEKEIQFFGI